MDWFLLLLNLLLKLLLFKLLLFLKFKQELIIMPILVESLQWKFFNNFICWLFGYFEINSVNKSDFLFLLKNVQFMLSVFVQPKQLHDRVNITRDHLISKDRVQWVDRWKNNIRVVSSQWFDIVNLRDQLS